MYGSTFGPHTKLDYTGPLRGPGLVTTGGFPYPPPVMGSYPNRDSDGNNVYECVHAVGCCNNDQMDRGTQSSLPSVFSSDHPVQKHRQQTYYPSKSHTIEKVTKKVCEVVG